MKRAFMTIELTVETGAIVENANSYVKLTFADAYLASRGNADWAKGEEDARATALIRAADVLNSYRWKGQPVEPGRIMAWPRRGMEYSPGNPVSENVVPIQVQNSQCEIAAAIVARGADPLGQVDMHLTTGAVRAIVAEYRLSPEMGDLIMTLDEIFVPIWRKKMAKNTK